MSKITKILSRIPIINRSMEVYRLRQKVDEVKIVYETLRSKRGINNVMLDVGSHHGGSLIQFAQLGWRVFAFEPDSKNREILVSKVSNMENVSIDNRAVSDRTGDVVAFYSSGVSTGISSMSSFHESHVVSGEVETVRLSDFCKENAIEKIDFLKIDTEGYDLMVLKGFDWESEMSPQFIVAEFEDRKTLNLGYSFKDMVKFLSDKGYYVLISEWKPIVEYGMSHNWLRFVEDPELVTDPNSWGNLIACKKEFTPNLQEIIRKFGYKIS